MHELYQSHAKDSYCKEQPTKSKKLGFKHISKELQRFLAYSVIHRQTGDHDFKPLSW